MRPLPIVVCLLLAAAQSAAAGYRAGVAVADITPQEPIRLSGYGSRTKPSEGVLTRIFAKALAIEQGRNERVVILTTDLIGLPRSITDVVAARVLKKYGIDRGSLLLNSSHTHTGPYIRGNLPNLFTMSAPERSVTDAYAERLQDTLVDLVGQAVAAAQPATILVAHGEAHFAVNRREMSGGAVKIGVNPAGPGDPDVPVLKVVGPGGRTLAVLFGYACHNTTLTGGHNVISGDYAGYAQQAIERSLPGATAMFLMLCGADQNPEPRGTPELARQHGEALGAEVQRVLSGKMTAVHGRIRGALQISELNFRQNDETPFGKQVKRYPYPVQALAFGRGLTILALGGEVLVGYDLRIKREFADRNVIVAGYSNDVMAYIPTLRESKEGGYEVVDSMRYYGLPGPWSDDTEERIMAGVHAVMNRVR
jgi:neutral ceramidase